MKETASRDLTSLTAEERQIAGDPPILGRLCKVARQRLSREEGLTLHDVAARTGTTHMTVLAWERRSDPRLVEFWKGQGFRFPDESVIKKVVNIGRLRTFSVGRRIRDLGAVAEWNGMSLRRVNMPISMKGALVKHLELDEHQYYVDEATGTYRFSSRLHGRRAVAVSYVIA